MQGIRAILFDLDGVLVDTRSLHFKALSQALSHHGHHLSHEEHVRFYDGLPTVTKLELLKIKFNLSPGDMKSIADLKQELTRTLLADHLEVNPEHDKIFGFLKDQGIPSAICSNTKRSTLDLIINGLNIKQHLEFTLSNEDVKDPKPSPEIYLKAMAKLKVSPSETLIFEDSPFGLEAARLSGAIVREVRNSDELTLSTVLDSILRALKAS